jgi:acyl carrier protein
MSPVVYGEAACHFGAPMIDDILHLVEAILGARSATPADRLLEDLDAESMDVVNIVAALEERYRVTLDEADLAEVRTIADLQAAVQAALGGEG